MNLALWGKRISIVHGRWLAATMRRALRCHSGNCDSDCVQGQNNTSAKSMGNWKTKRRTPVSIVFPSHCKMLGLIRMLSRSRESDKLLLKCPALLVAICLWNRPKWNQHEFKVNLPSHSYPPDSLVHICQMAALWYTGLDVSNAWCVQVHDVCKCMIHQADCNYS